MRLAISLTALSVLGACATTPTPAVSPPSPTPSAGASSSRAVALLESAGRDNAASRADIENVFGQPDIARQDGAGTALTYRLPTCALLLLFVADGGNVQRLAEAHASARRNEDVAPSLQQCALEASSR